MDKLSKKQITFDLNQKSLSSHYPRPKLTINPTFYKKAYSDIKRFMKKNGFEHRQYSVYVSNEKMSNSDINLLTQKLAKEMPWLSKCTNELDVTNVGSQHSLTKLLDETTKEVELESTKREDKGQSLNDWKSAILDSKENHNGKSKGVSDKGYDR